MKRTMQWMMTLGVVALALAFVACGGNGSSPSATDADADDAHVEADEHDADEHEADEENEATEHEAEAEPNAYLEIAPKDALYLVEMTSFAFTPDVLEVNAGEVLEIAIQNVEPVLHDFTIDKIDADVHISYLGGTGEHAHDGEMDMEAEMADLHFALTEPGSGVVHIKVHEPGVYVIYCSVPGHREAGMVGTLIIR
ncbi:MAG: cupredoxin domain-containing protein [Chloroflexi bacterium]|nr:cupredoxin domain-containing protein [Chloroflexota bacterium]